MPFGIILNDLWLPDTMDGGADEPLLLLLSLFGSSAGLAAEDLLTSAATLERVD